METYNSNNNQGSGMQTYVPGNNQGNGMQTYIPGSIQGNPTDNYNSHNFDSGPGFINIGATFEEDSVSNGRVKPLTADVVTKAYLFMVVALMITAGAALSTTPQVAYQLLFNNIEVFVGLLVGEMVVVLVANWALSRNNAILGGIMFVIYSYLTGVLFSTLLVEFTELSIAVIFFISAALFGIMAVFGMVTKKDLSREGSIWTMALLGIILVSLVNLVILNSSTVDTVICGVGVLIFVGLTAFHSQKIKSLVAMADDSNALSLALLGALGLYLDFINLFFRLARILGRRK